MTLEEQIELFESNAEYERTHESLQGCLEFRQLAEWLKDYKRLRETTDGKEEGTMNADCEFCIKRNICTRDVPKPCRYKYTEEERIADQASDRCGVILSATYLPKTYQKKDEGRMIDEAIKRLERKDGDLQMCLSFHQLANWLKDYKKLLEQEPCGDCISRQAVNELVDELARAISDERCCISRGRSTATIMRDIRHLPSVTAQPKMGKWEKRDVRGQRVDCCSVCGLSNGTIYEYNYCPNCGAKMQEVEG